MEQRQYIVTYNEFYKDSVLLEVDKIENGQYVLKCGYRISLNHLFTSTITEQEAIKALNDKSVLDGSKLEYYNIK